MSSSSDARVARVVRGAGAAGATGLATPELRNGAWTRLGGDRVLGDVVTEQTLASLAESTRAAARSQGYAIGWAQGRREAGEAARAAAEQAEQERHVDDARREAEHRTAVAALEAAAAELRRAVAASCLYVEEQASGLALELTRELVGHELASGLDGAAGQHVVRRALALLPETGVARLRVHPDVAAALDLDRAAVTVVADPDLGPADALVETDEDVVDLRVSTALDRLREVLG